MGRRLYVAVVLACWAFCVQGQGLPDGPDSCSASTLGKIALGVGSSAYQIEGGAASGGRTPSVWDTYAKNSGKVINGDTGDVATDFYDTYKSDIALMKSLGVKNFRMSISWSRLIPGGKKGSSVNPIGAAFYNDVFNTLIAAGISPVVTLYHWDLPQSLHNAYEGFLSPQIIDDFVYFADQSFKLFGDRVKKWTTFNEPWIVCNLQYGNGDFAPGITYGLPGRWKCGHHLLLAHAYTYKLYNEQYKPKQGGKLGMAVWSEWAEPWSDAPGDRRAAQNRMDVDFGSFADVIHFGDYPAVVKRTHGQYLPAFTESEKTLLKNSYDYFGITQYTAKWSKENPERPDGWWVRTEDSKGNKLGEQSESYWLYNAPWSIGRMLRYLDTRYGRPEIWVLENGFCEKGEGQRTGTAVLQDPIRIKYFSGYLSEACRAVDQGVKLTHYLAWSFTDNFEWREGYSTKYGIVHVDFKSKDLKRTVKDSGRWFSQNLFSKSSKQ